MFACTSFEEMKSKTNNPSDIRIIEELERLSMDNKFIFDYHCENDEKLTKLSIHDEGFNEGLQEGISQKTIEIAKNMLESNESIKTISKYTGLIQEEIEKLK